jgi:thymidylate synthase ThyX
MKITLLPESLVGDPEVVAMIQAFYSRSAKPIMERLTELGESIPKIKKALESFYIGYGHDSIADCGNIAVFFEGVSFLFAKAIQDNPLYNGQETSTRFITFTGESLIAPDYKKESINTIANQIQHNWMTFYEKKLPVVIELLGKQYPLEFFPDQDQTTWEKAIKARAFDIMRAFLPAGTTTQLSFYGSLRNVRDALSIMLYHPLHEVRYGAHKALEALRERYLSSFSKDKYSLLASNFIAEHSTTLFYNNPTLVNCLGGLDEIANTDDRNTAREWLAISSKTASVYGYFEKIPKVVRDFLQHRPKEVKVPYILGRYGTIDLKCVLDFGSYRDLQRHRNCKQLMPVLTFVLGMHNWYLDRLKELDVSLYDNALTLIKTNRTLLYGIQTEENIYELQYLMPLGARVPVEIKMGLDEAFYIAELRSTKYVHPTLRPVAQELGNALLFELPYINIYLDESEDAFNVKRGRQDITNKEVNS